MTPRTDTDLWTFGVDPLPQTVRAAAQLRRVTGLLLALEEPDPKLDELLDALEQAERFLSARAPAATAPPRVGAAADGDGRAYIDHSRHIGGYNPCFPEYRISVDGDEASGTVNFPLAYEGPPGYVHGGFLAVFFDCVIQNHHCDVGVAGKTVTLDLRYRRPTPLHRDLRFTVTRSAAGRRLHSTGRLLDGDELLCEATMEAVKGDRAKLPPVAPRRSHP